MIPRHLAFAASLGIALAVSTACRAEVHVIQMTTDASFEPRFVPDETTIRRGDTVRWVNTDGFLLDHATASGTGSADPLAGALWDSGILRAGESFEVTFQDTGDYEYFSPPHEYEGMFGIVHVSSGLEAGGEVKQTTWTKIKAQFDDLLPR